MSVKLRLQRRGRKKKPHYNIVAADSKKPRDGRPVEKLGYYNPNTSPATIELDNDKALYWLQVGAQPTPTVGRILTYRGVKYRKHLQRGVNLGILSQEEADNKYAKWLEDKAQAIQERVKSQEQKYQQEMQERLEAEAAINRKRAEAVKAKQAEEAGEEEGATEETAAADNEEPSEAGGEEEAGNSDETTAQQ